MRRFRGITWLAAAALATGLTGCGGNEAAPETGPVQAEQESAAATADPAPSSSPDAAVKTFLQAVRGGDDRRAGEMLTQLARRKTREMDLEVAPPGSDTAEFEIGKVEKLGEAGARVHCDWSDIDSEGNRTSEQIIWVLRKEDAGWRIAGMAPTIFPGEPPLLLNFEDPEEMVRKLKWVRREAARRAQDEAMQQARRSESAASEAEASEPAVKR